MATAALPQKSVSALDSKIKKSPGRIGTGIFGLALAGGAIYSGWSLTHDLANVHTSSLAYWLLGLALLIALGFEFVNGFHDTANAVATVIYTHSLEPHIAVVWSGMWNFVGVLTSSGAVAFGIVSLLPVELILQVGSKAGFAMVFALLVAAIIWNLGTWYFGIPNSSSHALIGSIMGVGLANQFMNAAHGGTSGVDWAQAKTVGYSLLLSPLIGFAGSALLLLIAKAVFKKSKELFEEPKAGEPPPFWIRALLILTCTSVSFEHGSNDGQKGMGLIMLILVGTVPTAYALNHAVGYNQVQTFAAVSTQMHQTLEHYVPTGAGSSDFRAELQRYIGSRTFQPSSVPALIAMVDSIQDQVEHYRDLAKVPPSQMGNVRNDMYLASEALGLMAKQKNPAFANSDKAIVLNYKAGVDKATKFIPPWVKVAVALALGLGTMVGWKRIVVTVGERIGKTHLTYAQGAASELIAAATIRGASAIGLPVSTTHVLTSGVAGTMTANGSGLQGSTLRSLGMAWVLTLPASIALGGCLYWVFSHLG
jgi:inorganic phosphate transporter, PiT family